MAHVTVCGLTVYAPILKVSTGTRYIVGGVSYLIFNLKYKLNVLCFVLFFPRLRKGYKNKLGNVGIVTKLNEVSYKFSTGHTHWINLLPARL